MTKSLTPETNYEKAILPAQEIFLTYDQERMIGKYDLPADETWLYLTYLCREYRIMRSTAQVQILEGDGWQNCRSYTQVLTIFDMLCYNREESIPALSGIWQPVGSFVITGSSPEADFFSRKYAKQFDHKAEKLRQVLTDMGAKPLPAMAGADVSFEVMAFSWFPVILRFWEGDEEFPPKVQLLWDKNTLQFLHFETTYYLQGDLLELILTEILKGE